MNIHERILDQTELAKCYAEDGAFISAARVLRGLAQEVQSHGEACFAHIEKARKAAKSVPNSLRVTTECHTCGGGTGQAKPCDCAYRHVAKARKVVKS